ncbi:CLUMA_CG003186, isoform A [Clunio marinus]|uniref:CLUMA_CG003186, isoform A n=1 Tax=Clunio marinus TaxID=568069 RepID=A0A1J1HN08_9DIPT|nr:CLUMA_CG003186, isoform A [Clunio marinus]
MYVGGILMSKALKTKRKRNNRDKAKESKNWGSKFEGPTIIGSIIYINKNKGEINRMNISKKKSKQTTRE